MRHETRGIGEDLWEVHVVEYCASALVRSREFFSSDETTEILFLEAVCTFRRSSFISATAVWWIVSTNFYTETVEPSCGNYTAVHGP